MDRHEQLMTRDGRYAAMVRRQSATGHDDVEAVLELDRPATTPLRPHC